MNLINIFEMAKYSEIIKDINAKYSPVYFLHGEELFINTLVAHFENELLDES